MDIGIIGAGMIASTVARLFAAAGHTVAISNTRALASLAELVAEIGHGARAVTVEAAAGFGEVVLVAIPLGQYETLPAARLRDKIVFDAMNDSSPAPRSTTGP